MITLKIESAIAEFIAPEDRPLVMPRMPRTEMYRVVESQNGGTRALSVYGPKRQAKRALLLLRRLQEMS